MTAREIADDLADRVARKEYEPGERLVFEDLMDLYDTSRSTIQRAMTLLYDRGVAVYRPGKGAYVRRADQD